MIVSDLDGTLLNDHFDISQENIATITALLEKGVILTLASGRFHHMMKDYYRCLKMDEYNNGYMVGLNGIELYSFKEATLLKSNSLISKQAAMVISKSIMALELVPVLMADHETIVIKDNHDKADEMVSCLKTTYQGAFLKVRTEYLNDLKFTSLNKFCILTTPEHIDEQIMQLKQALSKQSVNILAVGDTWIEIMPANINKANRIQEIMIKEKLQSDEIIVFGDSQTDLEMLQLTKNSYTMKNARKQVQAVAKHITDDNEHNGVAKILKQLL